MRTIVITFLWASISISSYSQDWHITDMKSDTIVNIKTKKAKKTKKVKNEKKSFASNDTIVIDSIVVVSKKSEQELLDERKVKAIDELQKYEIVECFHLISFIDSLLNANPIVFYFDKTEELQQLYKDISILHISRSEKVDYLDVFVRGIEAAKRANGVLNQPYNRNLVKQSKDEVLNLCKIFKSKNQVGECDSIGRSLSLYFLATSNMLSIIDEIEPLKDTLQTKQCDSLAHSAFDFENRNRTIEIIGYMKQLYAKLHETFPKNEDGQYDIHLIRWEEIDGIKQELIESRKTK